MLLIILLFAIIPMQGMDKFPTDPEEFASILSPKSLETIFKGQKSIACDAQSTSNTLAYDPDDFTKEFPYKDIAVNGISYKINNRKFCYGDNQIIQGLSTRNLFTSWHYNPNANSFIYLYLSGGKYDIVWRPIPKKKIAFVKSGGSFTLQINNKNYTIESSMYQKKENPDSNKLLEALKNLQGVDSVAQVDNDKNFHSDNDSSMNTSPKSTNNQSKIVSSSQRSNRNMIFLVGGIGIGFILLLVSYYFHNIVFQQHT